MNKVFSKLKSFNNRIADLIPIKSKNKKFIPLGILLLLTIICCSVPTGNNKDQSAEVIPVSRTDIAATVYAEFDLKTQIAATIYAEIATSTTNTPVPENNNVDHIYSLFPCLPRDNVWEKATVTSITDGDTIHVNMNGVDYPVRYIGIDCEEWNDPSPLNNTLSQQATEINSALVLGKEVWMIKDVSETDTFDRLLRYVFVDDQFVNYEIVKSGLAIAKVWEPDRACAETLSQAQNEASTGGSGRWGAVLIPEDSEAIEPADPQENQNCSPCYPDVCIPPAPPDLNCDDVSFTWFRVVGCDPHKFDMDKDGYGCQN